MSKKSTHVVPNKEKGGWDIKQSGGERSSGHFDTKKEAEARGREISKNKNTEFVIHNKDSKISRKDSHGNDPYPPKG
jgi:uncharacterized protein YdaT